MNHVSPTTAGFTIAASAAIIANTLLTWAKESYPALNAWMKSLLGHHWTTHGVFIVAAFILLGFILSRWPSMRKFGGTLLAIKIGAATILAGIGLVGFFFFA